MIDLIRAMFATPEAQPDAYAWAAVLLAHAMIGAVLTACLGLALGPARAAPLVALAYLVGWEGGQLLFAGAGLTDSLIDAAAVASGAALLQAAWSHGRWLLAGAAAGLAAMLAIGIDHRRGRR